MNLYIYEEPFKSQIKNYYKCLAVNEMCTALTFCNGNFNIHLTELLKPCLTLTSSVMRATSYRWRVVRAMVL